MFTVWYLCSVCFLTARFTEARYRRDRQRIICVHGVDEHGRCLCEEGYMGRHCEKRKHCNTFERHQNGTCVECEAGWIGEHCEQITCERGESDQEMQICICPKPYSGEHCEQLTTADIYSYYNHMAFSLGPLGLITIFPMLIALYGCEYMAAKRKVRRVESMLGEQHINVNRRVVSDLLEPKTV